MYAETSCDTSIICDDVVDLWDLRGVAPHTSAEQYEALRRVREARSLLRAMPDFVPIGDRRSPQSVYYLVELLLLVF